MSYLSEASLEVASLDNIKKHFTNYLPQEGCGLLIAHKGVKYWIACKNISELEDNFIIETKTFVNISRKYDIIALVHDHVGGSSKPSKTDEEICKVLQVPLHIYNYPSMSMTKVYPNDNKFLFGREYSFGENDCFEAIRDYYHQKMQISIPEREDFIDDWWKQGLDYFSSESVAKWGFYPVEDLQKGDLLVFSVHSKIPNHCGVYLGEDIFFHHAVNRISCRENLYPTWKKFITRVYRYET